MSESNEPLPGQFRLFRPPATGEVITALRTGNTYTIGERIGEGAFGVVFECIDTWGSDLAVKVLKPNGSYEDVRRAAIAEISRLETLRHPNITYVHDAFEYQDTFYIVTERCEFSLTALLELPDLKPDLWLMPVARCLLQAVHYLHSNHFAHQDIHPGNIFAAFPRNELTSTRDASGVTFKLGDLGVSVMLTELRASNLRAAWMLPPEVLREDEFGPIDHRVDIYHAALVLLQIACGGPRNFSEPEILAGVPRQLALGLPTPWNFALEKALRRHSQYRTATAMELWRDLHALEE